MNPESINNASPTRTVGAASIFAAATLLVMLVAIFVASKYPFLAGIYPIVIAIGVAITCIFELLKSTRGSIVSAGKGTTMDIAEDTDMPLGQRLIKTLIMLCWLLGLYMATFLVGFKLATLLFLGSYIYKSTAGGLIRTILVPIVTFLFLYAFQIYLGVYWPVGLLGEILEESIPLLF